MQETQETEVWTLGWEDPLEEGTATHFSILVGESQDRGAWQATFHRVAKSRTWLKWLHMHACTSTQWLRVSFLFLLICLQTWSPLFSSTPIPSFIRPCLSTFSHVRPPKPGSCTDMCRIWYVWILSAISSEIKQFPICDFYFLLVLGLSTLWYLTYNLTPHFWVIELEIRQGAFFYFEW